MMNNTTKFYEIVEADFTSPYAHEKHIVFFTSIEKAIEWLKSAGVTRAHDTVSVADLWNAKWYCDDNENLYENILTKTFIGKEMNYRVLERVFED